MLRFYAEFFVEALREVDEMLERWEPNDQIIPVPVGVGAKLTSLHTVSLQHGLTATAQKCARIMDRCARPNPFEPITYREIVGDLKHLRETLEDELQGKLFLHLSMAEADSYNNPRKGWEEVTARFGKVVIDVEESSKCFALERYGAAVFHVLLVAEYGIVELCKVLLPDERKPGWNALERLQRILAKKPAERSDLENEHSELLKNIAPLAFAMKDSWRHKISHVDNKLEWMDTDFSPEVAGEIISAARGFMRGLIKDLPRPASDHRGRGAYFPGVS